MGADQSYCTSCSNGAKKCSNIEVTVDSKIHGLASSSNNSPRSMGFLDDVSSGSDHRPSRVGQKVRGVLSRPINVFEVGGRSQDGEHEIRRIQKRLTSAARSGDFKAAVDAITDGANLHLKDLRGQTPLMLAAASYGKGPTLLGRGGDDVDNLRDGKNEDEHQPLDDVLRTIKFLVDAKADVEAKDELGWTALLHACRNNQQKNVDFLLQRGASMKARSNDGRTAMMLAALESADLLVQYLIKQKAQIDKKDEDGCSVLFYACREGRRDLVKALLDKGANAKEKAKDGSTPLMVAAEGGHVRVGKLLVKKGAMCDLKNAHGNTALLIALTFAQEEYAMFLIDDCNADVTIKNQEEDMAVNVADMQGMMSVKSHLEVKGRIQGEEGNLGGD